MAGPTQRVVAGSGWTEVLSARGRAALAEIDAYGTVQLAVAEGKPPRAGVEGHTVNGHWRRPLRGKEIVWARGAGVALIATLLWADPDLAFSLGQDGNAAAALEVAQGAAVAAGVADGKADSALDATGFNTPANALLKRPVVQRARDSVSALDLMTSGGLDNAVRNREVTAADAPEITSNMLEAVAACALRQWRLDVPAGTFHLNEKLEAERPISIVGAGETATWLQWANGVPSAGISISAGGINGYSQVSDMSMFCNDDGALGMHSPIKMDYSSLISGGSISPRASKMGGIRNITARSTFGGVGIGWGRGVELVSMLAVDVSDCRFNGVIVGASGNLPAAAEGIWFYGEGSPVQLTVDRVYLSAFTDAVRTQNAEGIYITNSEFVNVRRGYRTTNTSPESGVVISGTHMNVLECAFDMQNMQDVVLSNNLLYTIDQSTVSDAFFIIRDGCRNLDIFGNISRKFNVPTPMDGIKVLGGQDINIGHNTWFLNGQIASERAIRIAAEATNVTVARQTYPHATGAIPQIANASTSAEFAEWRDYSGDLNAINTSRRMIEQNHALAAGATNFPPTWADPVSGLVQTLGWSGLDAVQVARNPRFSGGAAFTRRKLGGTWSAWA